jgi:hypothetical protein
VQILETKTWTLSDQFAAMSALRKRPTLRDADLTVVGEASPDDVEWLDVKDGDIFCVMPIFMTARQKRTPKRKPQRRKRHKEVFLEWGGRLPSALLHVL